MSGTDHSHVHDVRNEEQTRVPSKGNEKEKGSLGSVQQKLQVQRNPDLTNRAMGETPASVSGLHICAQVCIHLHTCTSHILIDVASALL